MSKSQPSAPAGGSPQPNWLQHLQNIPPEQGNPARFLAIANWISVNDPQRLRFLAAEATYQAFLDEGDFIELGVYRGGSAVLLAGALHRMQPRRRLHLLDSWEGLPQLAPADNEGVARPGAFGDATEEGVRDVLGRLRLLPRCELYKGWFEETLPSLEGPFALAHIDCDLYEPVKFCLEHLLPRMTPHGVVVIDDYGRPGNHRFPGVHKAVAEVLEHSDWALCPLGGTWDASVKLIRTLGR